MIVSITFPVRCAQNQASKTEMSKQEMHADIASISTPQLFVFMKFFSVSFHMSVSMGRRNICKDMVARYLQTDKSNPEQINWGFMRLMKPITYRI